MSESITAARLAFIVGQKFLEAKPAFLPTVEEVFAIALLNKPTEVDILELAKECRYVADALACLLRRAS